MKRSREAKIKAKNCKMLKHAHRRSVVTPFQFPFQEVRSGNEGENRKVEGEGS